MLIIITGHGHFATGLQSTIELLAGLQAQLKYVDFTSEMSEAELHNELLKHTAEWTSFVLLWPTWRYTIQAGGDNHNRDHSR